jgi:4-diphosphocytidyl-2-C-methyl-D-erythritol kinase
VPVVVRVPAKVNLHLGVGPLRSDGFHELVTVFHAVDLFDVVVASPAAQLSVAVAGAAAGVPVDSGNLAWRAAGLLAEHAGVAPNVRLEITKAIPVAGGMAGGSADAAAALVACAELWRVPRSELPALAGRLGSDVPFPLLGGTALGTGRGEVLTPLPTSGSLHWVFALADHGISTADAYRELDRRRAGGAAPPPISARLMIDAQRSGDPARVAAAMRNDLQDAALSLVPALGRTLDAGCELGALAGIVSGSGPTCAFLCASAGAAARLAAGLDAKGVCHTTRVATGPAPGATIVPSGL